jgi:hypothetical protein
MNMLTTGKGRNARKLPALVDFAFEVTFFVQEVLELKMGLVHLEPGGDGFVLADAGCGVGCAVEGLEAGDESHGASVYCGCVVCGVVPGDEVAQLVEDVGRIWHESVG